MLVETSPLLGPPPPHPIAPREPKRVKCEAANTVREADYKIKLAEYQEEKTAHHFRAVQHPYFHRRTQKTNVVFNLLFIGSRKRIKLNRLYVSQTHAPNGRPLLPFLKICT